MLWYIILAYVIINIIQTRLIFSKKRLARGGLIIGFLEALEFLLMICLLLRRELLIFSVLVATEIVQWLAVAYFTTKD